MRNIVIKLHRTADPSGMIAAMRLWLDNHRTSLTNLPAITLRVGMSFA